MGAAVRDAHGSDMLLLPWTLMGGTVVSKWFGAHAYLAIIADSKYQQAECFNL